MADPTVRLGHAADSDDVPLETSEHPQGDRAAEEHMEVVRRRLVERFGWISWSRGLDDNLDGMDCSQDSARPE